MGIGYDRYRAPNGTLPTSLYRIWLEDEIGWKIAGPEPAPLTELEQS